jgi:hypothetical protein
MQTESEGSVFAGFKHVLHKGALIFALILTVLFAMIYYQHQRSAEAVRSVDYTRQIIAYIDALRIYLLNLDTAARKYAESQNPADLDPRLVCRQSPCPSAERLIALIRDDNVQAVRLAPLPALQLALETGFSALQQRAQTGVVATPPGGELGGFDKSAIDQIHRILIDTEREETAGDARKGADSGTEPVVGAAGYGGIVDGNGTGRTLPGNRSSDQGRHRGRAYDQATRSSRPPDRPGQSAVPARKHQAFDCRREALAGTDGGPDRRSG